MDSYSLQVNSNSVGGYFSSEQIDLLSIIQCNDEIELIKFMKNCDQFKYTNEELSQIISLGLEHAKRHAFKDYQDSMVSNNTDANESIENKLRHCDINNEDIEIIKRALSINNPESKKWLKEFIKNKYSKNYDEIFSSNHHFFSIERDQLKSDDLYEEMILLNSKLPDFNTMLIGSGRISSVVNDFYDMDNPSNRFDFYHAKRDLDFAFRNKKQVRFHSLLVKEDASKLFDGKSKDEILQIIKDYVKESIDFVSEYNDTHQIEVNGQKAPIINSIDLFNELVSFEKNKDGEYFNFWEEKYGISMHEILSAFEYAKTNKPDGVKYLYNEPFLEDTDRRKKVFETLDTIDTIMPGLIDTLGSQMHITFRTTDEEILDCYKDFKTLQDTKDKGIQITEFDLSLGKSEIQRVFGENPDISLEQAYQYKDNRIESISNTISQSGVKLDGISYWSLTDGIDFNLERHRTKALQDDDIKSTGEIPTACGGLFPTHKKLIKQIAANGQSIESSGKTL
jgi:GH35 family endo-1,4-beta-xylanase